MNDLRTIQRLNSEAVERSIPKALAKGKFVCSKYAGLNFVDFTEHDTHDEAVAAGDAYVHEAPGNSVKYLSPANTQNPAAVAA